MLAHLPVAPRPSPLSSLRHIQAANEPRTYPEGGPGPPMLMRGKEGVQGCHVFARRGFRPRGKLMCPSTVREIMESLVAVHMSTILSTIIMTANTCGVQKVVSIQTAQSVQTAPSPLRRKLRLYQVHLAKQCDHNG